MISLETEVFDEVEELVVVSLETEVFEVVELVVSLFSIDEVPSLAVVDVLSLVATLLSELESGNELSPFLILQAHRLNNIGKHKIIIF